MTTAIMSMGAVRARYHDIVDGHWFDADTMRFFKTRLPKHAFVSQDHAYFVTSEQGPYSPRRWSVRRMSLRSGEFETVGWFNGYATRAEAHAAMRRAMQGGL